MVEAVREFEKRALATGLDTRSLRAARYALCATIDDMVLSTPWGSTSSWAAQSLTSIFHNEVSGGERFFDILEQMQKDLGRHSEVVELMYLCTSLGFEGRYRVMPRGIAALTELRDWRLSHDPPAPRRVRARPVAALARARTSATSRWPGACRCGCWPLATLRRGLRDLRAVQLLLVGRVRARLSPSWRRCRRKGAIMVPRAGAGRRRHRRRRKPRWRARRVAEAAQVPGPRDQGRAWCRCSRTRSRSRCG